MVIDTNYAIAFRSIYGNFDFNEATLFNLERDNEGVSNLRINTRNKEITIFIKCPICCKHHNYRYNLSEIINNTLIIGGCEEVGIPVFYLGNSSKVRQRISKYNQMKIETLGMI